MVLFPYAIIYPYSAYTFQQLPPALVGGSALVHSVGRNDGKRAGGDSNGEE